MPATRATERMDTADGPDHEAARRALVALRSSYVALREHQETVAEQLDVAIALINEADRLLTTVQKVQLLVPGELVVFPNSPG